MVDYRIDKCVYRCNGAMNRSSLAGENCRDMDRQAAISPIIYDSEGAG